MDILFFKPLYTASDEDRYGKATRNSDKINKEEYRTNWRRDYSRLIHSPSFRRLQGKTQLFPNHESDFYRNRLTHSLEVAQIAKSIASKINHEYLGEEEKIDLDIVEIAGLAHDLGHPPFGHNGEKALDECMRDHYGGFEGNAQTLRILSRLEKKSTLSLADNGNYITNIESKDNRCGLNLTARVLASILKYPKDIPLSNVDRGDNQNSVMKGYYCGDKETVDFIKKSVLGSENLGILSKQNFKTVECQIMDVADDIAYSTYDLEDALKAGFLTPLNILSLPDHIYTEIVSEINVKLDEEYKDIKDEYTNGELEFNNKDLVGIINTIFGEIFDNTALSDTSNKGEQLDENKEGIISTLLNNIFDKNIHEDVVDTDNDNTTSENKYDVVNKMATIEFLISVSKGSKELTSNGYYRTDFTSDLVGAAINAVNFKPNSEFPALSKVYLDPTMFKLIETLKKLSYKSLIMSPMLKLTEYRGKKIVSKLFDALTKDKGYLLLPDDYRHMYDAFDGNDTERKRVVCDFIAGMTDRYALEFYNRLFGANPETIHKPI
ncbi:MAG: dNTP triphosphohydrolase [Proteobacteria bacterium]|nr:dNTP triphosphohydrolase [Pseudomonadota bacterium]